MTEKTEKKKRTKLPMACVHGDNPTDVRQRATYELRKVFGASERDLPMYERTFITQVVFALTMMNGRFDIDGIYADQWCGLTASNDDEIISVECDLVEDGVAAIFLHVLENYGWDKAEVDIP